jgi:hypothetical protein
MRPLMQTRRQWHVTVEGPTVQELELRIAVQDATALQHGYVRRSTSRRDFGAMGLAEAIVYEEAPADSPITERAELLGMKPARGPALILVIAFFAILVAVAVAGTLLGARWTG